jgi:hypothetical protein
MLRGRRAFAFTAAILFVLSWIFPVGAGLSKDIRTFPAWWGTVDVALAFVLAVAGFGVQWLIRGKLDRQAEETTYRVYRTITHSLLAIALVVMLAGDRVAWANCATGFPLAHMAFPLYNPVVAYRSAEGRVCRPLTRIMDRA